MTMCFYAGCCSIPIFLHHKVMKISQTFLENWCFYSISWTFPCTVSYVLFKRPQNAFSNFVRVWSFGWSVSGSKRQWSKITAHHCASLCITVHNCASNELAIDLMHNDVKQCFCGSNVHCGSCSHARIQYGVVFPWSWKFEWQKCWHVLHSDVAGPLSSLSGICLNFQIGPILRTFTISPTANTTGHHLGFERDYNYHAAFRACYVIMQKVY